MTRCRDGVYLGWRSWTTRVMDTRLETQSMTVYAGTLCRSMCRGVIHGYPMGNAEEKDVVLMLL